MDVIRKIRSASTGGNKPVETYDIAPRLVSHQQPILYSGPSGQSSSLPPSPLAPSNPRCPPVQHTFSSDSESKFQELAQSETDLSAYLTAQHQHRRPFHHSSGGGGGGGGGNHGGKKGPYHEQQTLEMCLVHALNALYQEKKFTQKDLDEICEQLAPDAFINPHKSIFNTGNYDVNVLMMALERQGIDVQWFDSRKAAKQLRLKNSFLCPNDEYAEFKGFILNNTHKKMMVFNRRHWLTIKRIKGVWYNLDSRIKQPLKFESEREIRQLEKWIIDACNRTDAQLLICRVKHKQDDIIKKKESPKIIHHQQQEEESKDEPVKYDV